MIHGVLNKTYWDNLMEDYDAKTKTYLFQVTSAYKTQHLSLKNKQTKKLGHFPGQVLGKI